MKKFLVLVLALVMALSLAAPALAFTEVEYDADDAAAALAIKLVDVSAGFVNINFTAPPSNRGYLKNEVVCAVVSLFVPAKYDLVANGSFTDLIFTGENVSVWQDDNFYSITGTASGGGTGMLQYMSNNAKATLQPANDPFAYADPMAVKNEITLDLTSTKFSSGVPFVNNDKDQTYHFAVFGKVVADDAKMIAKLVGTGGLENASDNTGASSPGIAATSFFNFVSVKDDYNVGYLNPNADKKDAIPASKATNTIVVDAAAPTASNDDGKIVAAATDIVYYVEAKNAQGIFGAGDGLFAVVTDKKFNCKALWVCDNGTSDVWYRVNVLNGTNAKNQPGAVYADFWGCYVQFESAAFTGGPPVVTTWTVLIDPADIGGLLTFVCEDIVWDVFKLNPALSGQMKDSWWANNKELVAEVTVEPWYAEVTVPTEIELEAPKTGDVVSALGFVLVALAGLAFVAVRKVKA